MFAPWRFHNPLLKTDVSDYWKIIHWDFSSVSRNAPSYHPSESDKQAFTLPPDKVHRFVALRDNILSHKTVALKTLQKFAGKTTSFSLLVPGAKLYTNAAYQAISKASRSHKPIPVSAALKAELLHLKFLDSWDGFLPWKDERHTSVTIFFGRL